MPKSLLQTTEDELLKTILTMVELIQSPNSAYTTAERVNLLGQLAGSYSTVRGYSRNTGSYQIYNSQSVLPCSADGGYTPASQA